MQIAGRTRRIECITERIEAAAFAALGLLASVSTAAAQEVVGTWERDTGRFTRALHQMRRRAPCGTALLAQGRAGAGQGRPAHLLRHEAERREQVERGSAFNPEDGKTYSGTMTLSGSTLTTAGCVMGVG